MSLRLFTMAATLAVSLSMGACALKESEPQGTKHSSDSETLTQDLVQAQTQSLPPAYTKIDYEGGIFSLSPLVAKGSHSYETSSFLVYESERNLDDLILFINIPETVPSKVTDVQSTITRAGTSVNSEAIVQELQSQSDTLMKLNLKNFGKNYNNLGPDELVEVDLMLSYALSESAIKIKLKLQAPPAPKTMTLSLQENASRSFDIDPFTRAVAVGGYDLVSEEDQDFILPVYLDGSILGHYRKTTYQDSVPGHSKPGGTWQSNDCDPTPIQHEFFSSKSAKFLLLPIEASNQEVVEASKLNPQTQYSFRLEAQKRKSFVLYALVNSIADVMKDLGTCDQTRVNVVTSCQRTICHNYSPPAGCGYNEGVFMCSGQGEDPHNSAFCTSWSFDIVGRDNLPENTTLTGYAYSIKVNKYLLKSIPVGQGFDQGIGGRINVENQFKATIKGSVNFGSKIEDNTPTSCEFSI